MRAIIRYTVIVATTAILSGAFAYGVGMAAPRQPSAQVASLPSGFTRSDTANGVFLTAHGAQANAAVSLSPDGRVCVGLLTLDGATVLIRCEPNS